MIIYIKIIKLFSFYYPILITVVIIQIQYPPSLSTVECSSKFIKTSCVVTMLPDSIDGKLTGDMKFVTYMGFELLCKWCD